MRTDAEYIAMGMLLGMEFVKGSAITKDGKIHKCMFKKRVADGRFHGTALFSYFDADSLEPIPELQMRSELDKWMGIQMYDYNDPLPR